MKLFPKKLVVVSGSGGGSLPAGAMVLYEDTIKLTSTIVDSNSALSSVDTFALTVTTQESNASKTVTDQLTIQKTGSQNQESNAIPSEARAAYIRYWAGASTDNDSSKTTPTNANGQNDGTNATIKTALSVGDLTNPVALTSTTFGVASSGTFTSKLIRVWATIAAPVADTCTLSYNIGSGDVAFLTVTSTNTLASSTGTFTFDISSLTLSQLASITLKANYLAAVVAVPVSVINLDAWCIELVGTI